VKVDEGAPSRTGRTRNVVRRVRRTPARRSRTVRRFFGGSSWTMPARRPEPKSEPAAAARCDRKTAPGPREARPVVSAADPCAVGGDEARHGARRRLDAVVTQRVEGAARAPSGGVVHDRNVWQYAEPVLGPLGGEQRAGRVWQPRRDRVASMDAAPRRGRPRRRNGRAKASPRQYSADVLNGADLRAVSRTSGGEAARRAFGHAIERGRCR